MNRSLTLALAFALTACSPEFDLILDGGTVIDGTGAPGYAADVGVQGGRIAEVGDLSGRSAAERFDVSGHVVAPGFIDPHTHSRGTIFEIPTANNMVRQGVTTLVEGNDGNSPLDLAAWYDSLSANGGTGPNFAMFIGHGSIRREVIGTEDRVPTVGELETMKAHVAQGMEDGALGLSTGLFYLPGIFATTEEVIELSKVAAASGGIYISHMRNEGDGVFESVHETIRIGREAGIPVQMTHHKIGAHRNFGRSQESIDLIREARAEGVDVTFDQYPYTASSTGLSSIIPRWAQEGDGLEGRLADSGTRSRIVDDMMAFVEMRFADDPAKIQLVSCRFEAPGSAAFPDDLAGWTLADIFSERGVEGAPAAIAELILEIDQAGGCSAIFHAFHESDVERLMQSEYGMIGSDGSLVHFGVASPHPRGYGTFPRVLGRYARERGILSMEEAVRRMTSAPADRLGFTDRGRIAEGAVADLTVFDPETVIDRATFEDPHQYPIGIPHVFVRGVAIVRDGEVTGARPGVVLRGSAGCLSASCAGVEQQEEFGAFGPFVDSLMVEFEVPGVGFALFDDEGVLFEHVAGVKRQPLPELIDRETSFEAASITKPVFAYVVMSLARDGVLDLDAPLLDLVSSIPELAYDARSAALTPRMLLTHQGGLPNWRSRLDFGARSYGGLFPPGDTLRFASDPGTAYRYSGEGYVLLQRIVEEKTGKDLDELVTENVFGPLGMSRSSVVFDDERRLNYSFGHNAEGTADKWEILLPLASTTLHTTAADLALFGIHVASQIREEGPFGAMAMPTVTLGAHENAERRWGPGLGIVDVGPSRYVYHGGNNVIFIADFIYGVDDNLGYALLTNSSNGARLVEAVERRVFGRDLPR